MRITLSVTEGPHTGQVFSFEEHDNFIVGRSTRAHFRLPMKDKYFSRIHFMVEVNPPQCRLMDMGSTNGTYVNGQKVSTADLKDGDQIRAGKTVLTLSVQQPAADIVPAVQPANEMFLPTSPQPIQPVKTPPPPPVPAVPVQPAPEAPPPVVREPAHCRVCECKLEATTTEPAGSKWLCPTCLEKVQRHAQPIAGYLIVREQGRGGMGVVYQAVRETDGAFVALKTIIPAVAASRSHVERFLREANILKGLEHPNIVCFREMGEADGQLFFAMDFVRGTDGAGLLKRNGGPLAISRAAELVCQLLDALEYAHARKFVHRDIKPANFLVATHAGRESVKLADFGLARVYQASHLSGLTMMGDMGGTVAFMPPEQITHYREAKPPVDQYAAGATLYNLLTDKFIYDMPKHVQKQLLMVLQENSVPIQDRRPDVPRGLAKVVHRAIAREPAERFQDVQAFREALRPYCR